METFNQYISGRLDILVYLLLVVVEQVLLLAPGTWPYRYGFPVRFIRLGLSLEEHIDRLATSPVLLKYNVDAARKEVCFRSIFPLWIWAPQLFTGQTQFEGRGKVIIRMAPLTSLGVIYLFLNAIGTFQLHGFAIALLLALLLVWYYRRLVGQLDFLL